ncbi:MAG: glycosyltransferase family 4 protein [Ginsengibacter sp.]
MISENKFIHIVCHDVPYPPDYGGVFDLFYKIKSLHRQGVKIKLHCFEYGRGQHAELNHYCVEVNYYRRRSKATSLSFRLPYIVSSRISHRLITNLQKDQYPVLLEGVHCTWPLYKSLLENRQIFVRLHNTEYLYYRALAAAERNLYKKLYFIIESRLLHNYEKKIAQKAMFIAVSKDDMNTYTSEFGSNSIKYLPVFLPFDKVVSMEGTGTFCLYHGNLSVPENEKAAIWLLENIFDTLDIPLVIAGKNPSAHLKKAAEKNNNTCLVHDITEKDMNELIRKAQIHILPSFNQTGVKIKLLQALYQGRFVITNNEAVSGTELHSLVSIANSVIELKELISSLFQKNFAEKDIIERDHFLKAVYNNTESAKTLMKWIW